MDYAAKNYLKTLLDKGLGRNPTSVMQILIEILKEIMRIKRDFNGTVLY